jgi:uncharacterized protein (TIGR02266 family)
MDDRKHNVMLTGFDDADALRIVSALGAFDIDFHRVAWNDGLSGLLKTREFDAVLFKYPCKGLRLELFLDALRSDAAMSRHAGAVVFADDRQLQQAEQLLGRGINRVVHIDDTGDSLRESVLSLLDVAHRFPVRAPVELIIDLEESPQKAFCHTENLSMSGMLVNCLTRFPVGTVLEFELTIPGEEQPIRGAAQVARLTDPQREQVLGMGAAFTSFMETDRARLRGALSRQIH